MYNITLTLTYAIYEKNTFWTQKTVWFEEMIGYKVTQYIF